MDASYKAVLPALSSGTTAFTDANISARTCVLPNSRMTFYAKNGVPPQTSKSTAQNYLSNYQKAAANLLLSGAFNVNSTSMPAWRALLSSLSGNNPTGGVYGTTGTAFSPLAISDLPFSFTHASHVQRCGHGGDHVGECESLGEYQSPDRGGRCHGTVRSGYRARYFHRQGGEASRAISVDGGFS